MLGKRDAGRIFGRYFAERKAVYLDRTESSILSSIVGVYIFHLFFEKVEIGLYLLVFLKNKRCLNEK